MIRLTGFVILTVGLGMIAFNLIRFSATTFANARDRDSEREQWSPPSIRVETMNKLGNGMTTMVKYLVIPSSMILVGGALLERTRRPSRPHVLRLETHDEED